MAEDGEPDPEAVRIGATIRALRKAYGLKLGEFAALIGKTDRYLKYIEAGQRRAPIPLCRQIADKLGVPLAAITVEGYQAVRQDTNGDGEAA